MGSQVLPQQKVVCLGGGGGVAMPKGGTKYFEVI